MKNKMILLPLILLAVICCYPVFFLLTGALMDSAELKERLGPVLGSSGGFVSWTLLPQYPTMQNYVELLLDTPEFFVMFWNSVKLTAGVLAGQLLVGVPAAWGFARFEFPLRRWLYMLYVILMMMPFQVRMLSDYLVLDSLNLLDTHLGIILPAVFSTFPVFIMYRFFRSIPEAVIESAKLDGAGSLQIFVYIGLPLGAGGIVSALVLNFLEYWNLIEQPLTFLKDKTLWPLSLFLPNIGLEQAGIAFTSSVVTLIPSVFVFLLGQDYLEQGIAAAAVKE
ncbi:ABC transporter, permease protein [Marvinbryantia formatexigens DSM 14469]|uniref:ABC transporter, permease protein n=1 Tax=Marvinbryantia formatexigens DSM 14469 TaxID=478749 RepID=C6LKP4_9FIRM|nr:carbohydrate ABC transporter permease [Marvinbryantia formatexigens]EET58781.1 ABC transporter, permease protein [Marvinbryantia formatexigens DSM 14469]UWO24124.1 carbohydrate ABC transporter permease [Marvinbryantia formatexigens DSM 14469]SDG69583.1 carbohydrate ABC transporter membrane protein 2, CUT1 family (TC 3.A.1.1.-) [Marvinbryantia formatexigens]